MLYVRGVVLLCVVYSVLLVVCSLLVFVVAWRRCLLSVALWCLECCSLLLVLCMLSLCLARDC